jgi:hypothetical protein
MGKKKQTIIKQSSHSAGQQSGGALAGWFKDEISRRRATKRLGKGLAWASALGIAGVTIYKLSGSGEAEVSKDSLELQKQEGWNVGSTDRPLIFPGSGLLATDSRRGAEWKNYLDSNKLIAVYQPPSGQWQPFFVPTLMQSLSQASLRSQMQVIQTPEMLEVYKRGEGLRELIGQAQNAAQTLIVADLNGPASVALGAALADTAQLVPAFDNWPHPLGVVSSHETLGALLFYAREVEEKKAKLKDNAPAIVLLDKQRLNSYQSEDTQFDNRWLAKIPPADQLKQRGITSLLYVVNDEKQKQELDDLNEEFVELQKQGIQTRLLPLSEFKPFDEEVQAAPPSGTGTTGGTQTVRERHYYYGGSPFFHWWFYNHYFYNPYPSVVVYRGGRSVPLTRPSSPPPFQPPPYRPATRPTIFSGTRVGGGASGVGKNKPSGFGRTSVRQTSGGQVTGVRSGRSGSYGRSSGSWFGG